MGKYDIEAWKKEAKNLADHGYYNLALNVYFEILEQAREQKDIYTEANTLRLIGQQYAKLEEYEQALCWLQRALLVASGIKTNLYSLESDIRFDLCRIYHHLDDPESFYLNYYYYIQTRREEIDQNEVCDDQYQQLLWIFLSRKWLRIDSFAVYVIEGYIIGGEEYERSSVSEEPEFPLKIKEVYPLLWLCLQTILFDLRPLLSEYTFLLMINTAYQHFGYAFFDDNQCRDLLKMLPEPPAELTDLIPSIGKDKEYDIYQQILKNKEKSRFFMVIDWIQEYILTCLQPYYEKDCISLFETSRYAQTIFEIWIYEEYYTSYDYVRMRSWLKAMGYFVPDPVICKEGGWYVLDTVRSFRTHRLACHIMRILCDAGQRDIETIYQYWFGCSRDIIHLSND
ncbi:MAG: tetratricopeptide repeat protein [Erysipelotrichaceae bacterium]|nr:tetratricopeptide repeat protein [Erysipelotrichaceae bacterium]